MTPPQRILVRGNRWLGDAVMSLPTIEGLRRMFPAADVQVLTHPALADLYGGAAVTRPDGHDLAVILPRSFRAAWGMMRAGIPQRVGYSRFGESLLLTDPVPRTRDVLTTHRVHYFFRLLRALGEPPEPDAPKIHVSEEARAWARERMPDGPRWVAINPGATYGPAKQWLPERFAELAARLRAQAETKLVLVGNERVPGIDASVDLVGATTVMQLAAALEQAALLVTNDTGPMHVADAVGTPVVAIFGSTDPLTTSPFGKAHAIVRHPIDCAPCLKRTCPLGHHRCMTMISVDEVYHHVMDRLR